MTDADTLAAELSQAVETERLRQQAPDLARRNAMLEAGIPLDKSFGRFFEQHYSGPLDPDHVAAEWYRTMLDQEPPAEVTERIRTREGDERIARFRTALDSPHPDQE